MADANVKTKMVTSSVFKRKENWTHEEVSTLVKAVQINKKILLGKFSQEVTKLKRLATWEQIAKRVSAVSVGGQRSGNEARKKWQTLTSATKKKESTRKMEQRKTGGGALPSQCVLTPVEEGILSCIPKALIGGIQGGVDTEECVGATNIKQEMFAVMSQSCETDTEQDEEMIASDSGDNTAHNTHPRAKVLVSPISPGCSSSHVTNRNAPVAGCSSSHVTNRNAPVAGCSSSHVSKRNAPVVYSAKKDKENDNRESFEEQLLQIEREKLEEQKKQTVALQRIQEILQNLSNEKAKEIFNANFFG